MTKLLAVWGIWSAICPICNQDSMFMLSKDNMKTIMACRECGTTVINKGQEEIIKQ